MKSKNLFLSISALLSTTICLVGCGETSSSSNTSHDEISQTDDTSSSIEIIKTEKLTDEMFNQLKLGFSATLYSSTKYDGSDLPSTEIYDIKLNEGNFEVQKYTTDKESPTVKKSLSSDFHYQKDTVNGSEDYPILSSVGLSVGNSLIYSPVMGRDQYTGEDTELYWDDASLDNLFSSLSSSDFTRVNDENKFELKLNTDNVKNNNIEDKIVRQLYSPDLQYDFDLPNTSIDTFYILTNGNEIVGFELNLKSYLIAEDYATKSSYGAFVESGSNVTSNVKVLEGTEDPVFTEAIDKLKTHNYKMVQTQSGRNFYNDKVSYLGKYEAQVEDGKSILYNVYNSSDEKIINFGYYDIAYEGESCKQGVTKIKDNFFKEYIYTESVESFLPEFNFSSLLFNKNESESTSTKTVYELDKDIKISLDNDSYNYTSFDADGYADRTVYMTITIEEDKVTIHNQTNETLEEFGLSIDVEYSNFGKVKDLIPESKIKNTTEGLTWTDLVSGNEKKLNSLLSNWKEEVINAIPSIGNEYCLINMDLNNNSPTFYVVIYDEDEIDDLIDSYREVLLANGYSYVSDKISEGATQPEPNFVKNENVLTPKGKEYGMYISLSKFWNGNPGYEYGQFLMEVKYGSKK